MLLLMFQISQKTCFFPGMLSVLKYFRWPALKGKTDVRWSKWSEARQGFCCCFCLFGHKLCPPCSSPCLVKRSRHDGLRSKSQDRLDWEFYLFTWSLWRVTEILGAMNQVNYWKCFYVFNIIENIETSSILTCQPAIFHIYKECM